jgi:hypothetical protein
MCRVGGLIAADPPESLADVADAVNVFASGRTGEGIADVAAVEAEARG